MVKRLRHAGKSCNCCVFLNVAACKIAEVHKNAIKCVLHTFAILRGGIQKHMQFFSWSRSFLWSENYLYRMTEECTEMTIPGDIIIPCRQYQSSGVAGTQKWGPLGDHYKCRGRQNSWGAIFILISQSWFTYNFRTLCLQYWYIKIFDFLLKLMWGTPRPQWTSRTASVCFLHRRNTFIFIWFTYLLTDLLTILPVYQLRPCILADKK